MRELPLFFGAMPANGEATEQVVEKAKDASGRGPSGGETDHETGSAVRPGVLAEPAPQCESEEHAATGDNA